LALLSAVRSLAAYVFIALWVGIVGPAAILIAVLVRSPALLYHAGYFAVRVGMALVGLKFTVRGGEHILVDRAAVYVVNHASNLEPPIIFCMLRPLHPRLSVLYKAELRKLPILVWGFDLAGFVPLERANRGQSLPAVDRAAEAVRDGMSFMIYPEGTRSRTGELLPFKKGGFIMAIKAQAPVVPVAIKGARDAMRKGSPLIRPVTARVRLAAPIETAGLTMDDRDALIARVRDQVGAMLETL
jgi:1-acyl-sn-glycerol-3-phosphate acyltransferase